jgi:AcrR family transcriptional regulator
MARPPSDKARAALLGAAAAILAEVGVSGFTVEEVVRRSGVAKTTLYRQFGGADGLVFALVGTRVRAAPSPDTGSLRGDLAAIQRGYLAQFEDPLSRELFVWMVTRALQSAEGAALFAAVRIQPEGPTAVALRRAIERGELGPDTDIDLAIHTIQGPLISRRAIGNEAVDEASFEALLTATLRALRAAGAP